MPALHINNHVLLLCAGNPRLYVLPLCSCWPYQCTKCLFVASCCSSLFSSLYPHPPVKADACPTHREGCSAGSLFRLMEVFPLLHGLRAFLSWVCCLFPLYFRKVLTVVWKVPEMTYCWDWGPYKSTPKQQLLNPLGHEQNVLTEKPDPSPILPQRLCFLNIPLIRTHMKTFCTIALH